VLGSVAVGMPWQALAMFTLEQVHASAQVFNHRAEEICPHRQQAFLFDASFVLADGQLTQVLHFAEELLTQASESILLWKDDEACLIAVIPMYPCI